MIVTFFDIFNSIITVFIFINMIDTIDCNPVCTWNFLAGKHFKQAITRAKYAQAQKIFSYSNQWKCLLLMLHKFTMDTIV